MRSVVRFGDFRFDPESGELTRDGRKVPLQRQPARLLELLIARAGEVVTRDEIRGALWGDTHVDFERSLNFCVAKLRAALRDDATSPRFVETVPTRGYRFIGEREERLSTEAIGDVSAKVEGASQAPGTTRRSLGGWLVAAGVAAVLVVIAGQSLWSNYGAGRIPKVVVVPFHNETGAVDFDRVAKGVSDAAVARLAIPDRLPHLLVIGNATDVRFSFKPRDMKATGDALGAQYLLLGQLKKDDRQLRIVAHLIRVGDQTHLWAKTYDTPALDLQQQASIAEEIARSVTETLTKH